MKFKSPGETTRSNSMQRPPQYVHTLGCSISLASKHPGCSLPVLSSVVEITENTMIAVKDFLRRILVYTGPSMKRLQTENRNSWLAYQQCFLFRGTWCSNITGILWYRQIHIHDLLCTFEVALQHHCGTVKKNPLVFNCSVRSD